MLLLFFVISMNSILLFNSKIGLLNKIVNKADNISIFSFCEGLLLSIIKFFTLLFLPSIKFIYSVNCSYFIRIYFTFFLRIFS